MDPKTSPFSVVNWNLRRGVVMILGRPFWSRNSRLQEASVCASLGCRPPGWPSSGAKLGPSCGLNQVCDIEGLVGRALPFEDTLQVVKLKVGDWR
jgi:hypothetical protein